MKQESEQEGVRNIERQTEGEGGVVQDGSDRVARCCNCCISCEANRYRVLTRTPEDYACRRSLCLNAASFFLCFIPSARQEHTPVASQVLGTGGGLSGFGCAEERSVLF